MFRRGLLFFTLVIFFQSAFAQDTLPNISVTLLGNKARVAWRNQYDNVTSITIQRSGDSIRNFKSIGSVFNAGAKANGYVDQKEFLPNEEYYRLFITFEGGDFIFTKAWQPVPDTSDAGEPVVIDAPETKTEIEQKKPEKTEIVKVEEKPAPKYFEPSGFVYTGKNQNIVLELPDAEKKKYSVKFFEDDDTFLFELKKIPESYLILDRSNFSHSGLYKFELYENGKLKEKHKVYLPQPGKRVPLLDPDGYEIKR